MANLSEQAITTFHMLAQSARLALDAQTLPGLDLVDAESKRPIGDLLQAALDDVNLPAEKGYINYYPMPLGILRPFVSTCLTVFNFSPRINTVYAVLNSNRARMLAVQTGMELSPELGLRASVPSLEALGRMLYMNAGHLVTRADHSGAIMRNG